MSNNRGLTTSLEQKPLKGEDFDFNFDDTDERSCFLSPFLCGAQDPKLIAYVHVGIMLAVSAILFLIFVVVAIVNKDILFYVGLIGAIVAFIPLPFLIFALVGLLKRRANTSIPLIVFLCFVGVSFTVGFAFVMIILFGADTNMQFLLIFGYGLTMTYLSHIIRVLLRVRLDTLEERKRLPSQLR
ncbi:hypothetical protein PMAYCL1PPCAC_04396 [Pristionchus mayeri]|uniref:Uncharacterized protein n=1 Tax=Pristionchus mayeri TaxID=1317129 RepID=A0AAN4Z532_9BILA|nr:hypothetical protein PMAYCL1PPCAC_04396 [Pristionchus mayeri]